METSIVLNQMKTSCSSVPSEEKQIVVCWIPTFNFLIVCLELDKWTTMKFEKLAWNLRLIYCFNFVMMSQLALYLKLSCGPSFDVLNFLDIKANYKTKGVLMVWNCPPCQNTYFVFIATNYHDEDVISSNAFLSQNCQWNYRKIWRGKSFWGTTRRRNWSSDNQSFVKTPTSERAPGEKVIWKERGLLRLNLW